MVETAADLLAVMDDGEDAKLDAWICPGCGQKGFVGLSRAGPHIKASCAECGRYARFVRQKLPPAERAYWDSRKSP